MYTNLENTKGTLQVRTSQEMMRTIRVPHQLPVARCCGGSCPFQTQVSIMRLKRRCRISVGGICRDDCKTER